MSAPDSKLPIIAALFLVILGLLIGVISGIGSGSLFGGIVAGLAIIPACLGMWNGIQNKESQAGLAGSILVFLASVGVAGLLIALKLFDWAT